MKRMEKDLNWMQSSIQSTATILTSSLKQVRRIPYSLILLNL
ncbi:hypothetical protein B4U80_02366 [Leptotrombidium deliense]|uniref:Uncharacterized protein n=1 Tax=Leptotrombidium deliense TaxID=299467 RepID=A0A443SIX1_9ACAR|nr:hypothetical protein B4U80_02366 [Leptotrombidium deliense]